MGKSITPKYRIEIKDNSLNYLDMPLAMAWNCGKPTTKKLEEYIYKLIDSYKIGGCNEHISLTLGYMPIPNKARIINQKTGDIVIEWNAPVFMEI